MEPREKKHTPKAEVFIGSVAARRGSEEAVYIKAVVPRMNMDRR